MASERLLRIEQRNSAVPIERKPPWIRTTMRTGPEFLEIRALVREEGLHTVCQEAGCPNIYECWEDREATFLIGGEQCSRRCDFVRSTPVVPRRWTGANRSGSLTAWRRWAFRYATVTGVARDDLPDEGVASLRRDRESHPRDRPRLWRRGAYP